jgi:hypothetical protein
MVAVDWLTVTATVVGGAVALGGSLLAHLLSTRAERRRTIRADRRQGYVDYITALDAAQALLRQLADPADVPSDLAVRARRSFGEAGVFEAREKLLLSADPSVVAPAEQALRLLAALRNAVRDGAKLHTPEYHDVYHPYAAALWGLRRVIRTDLGQPALTPADIDKPDWEERASCDFCQARASVPAPRGPA